MKITLFIPCFIDQYYPGAGIGMVRILEKLGHTVEYPESQTCCGQPAFNSGYWDEARSVAETMLDAFKDAEVVVGVSPYGTAALERCDAGVSGCDCLVAQTGGILVTSASAGGRVLSVLPPHHVVIASTAQLVGDLSDAFAHLRKSHDDVPAFASFITGPSRTGDIERILVLGAHGPKKLTVLLLQDGTHLVTAIKNAKIASTQ